MTGRCEAGKDVRENEKRSVRYAGPSRERYEHNQRRLTISQQLAENEGRRWNIQNIPLVIGLSSVFMFVFIAGENGIFLPACDAGRAGSLAVATRVPGQLYVRYVHQESHMYVKGREENMVPLCLLDLHYM